MKKIHLLYVLCFILVIAIGCQRDPKEPKMTEEDQDQDLQEVSSPSKERIEVELMNQEGISIGTATLTEEKDGVQIHVEANHLTSGLHGFHIHEKGLCETPNFESAGGHFNPDHKNHGFDDPAGAHAGDMENLRVEEDGTVDTKIMNDQVTLKKDAINSLFSKEGTSLMIHANPDDYKSQPAGDAGERIVCGVISKAEK